MVNVSGLNLTKGQSLDFTKGSTLKNLILGMGWDIARGVQFDLDLSLMIFRNGNFVSDTNHLIFFNNLTLNGIKHTGDNRTGEGFGDDEAVLLDLTQVDNDVTDMYVLANIYKVNGQPDVTFGSVENSYCRIVDNDTNKELCRYNLNTESTFGDAMVVGKIHRVGNSWEFKALGNEYTLVENGSTDNVLGKLLDKVVTEVHSK